MFRRFWRDQSGNFAVMTGLIATVLVGSLGGALDLSIQWADQGTVQRAVDAAALAGAKALETGTEADARSAVQMVGEGNIPDDFPPVSFVTTIDQAAGTVSVSGQGSIEPYFLKLFQIKQLSIATNAQALIQRKSYIDFYFLLDVSESMNIAASDADRRKLEAITQAYNNRPCAFACHVVEGGWAPISVYQMNELQGANKAKLRIDLLREAASGMIDKILALNTEPGSLRSARVATAGFSWDFLPGVAPTNNGTILKASIKALSGNDHTNMSNAITGFQKQIGAQGKGTSASDTRKFAILVTDGVRDTGFGGGDLGPLDPALCAAIKNKGIDLAVLEIKYVADRDRFGFFDNRVGWYYDRISPNLKTCASSGLYYQALDSGQAQGQLMKMVDDLLTIRRRLSS